MLNSFLKSNQKKFRKKNWVENRHLSRKAARSKATALRNTAVWNRVVSRAPSRVRKKLSKKKLWLGIQSQSHLWTQESKVLWKYSISRHHPVISRGILKTRCTMSSLRKRFKSRKMTPLKRLLHQWNKSLSRNNRLLRWKLVLLKNRLLLKKCHLLWKSQSHRQKIGHLPKNSFPKQSKLSKLPRKISHLNVNQFSNSIPRTVGKC